MNELEKMRNSELADMDTPELQKSFIHAKSLLARMRTMSSYDEGSSLHNALICVAETIRAAAASS